jgi:ribonuclease VapC
LIAVDASALLAILLDEPEGPAFHKALQPGGGVISPVNHWEVMARAFTLLGDAGLADVEELMDALDVQVTTVTVEDSRAAFAAFRRFGRHQGGPLNLGDCFAYAVAAFEGDGLLFKGDDFPKTDVRSALA